MAGYDHVIVDGTVIETDRVRTPGPTGGADLWWSRKIHNALRAVGERANALLKSFKALRNASLAPWKIGLVVKAALVILHTEHQRTT